MIDFTLERNVAAPVETVFARLTDHRAYAQMTALRRSVLEQEGETDVNGVGAIRRLTLAGPPMRERVTAYEAPSHFRYELLSGLPVRDHVGDVRCEPTGGGTHVVYRVTSQATFKPSEPVVGAVLKLAIGRLLDGVAKAAERAP